MDVTLEPWTWTGLWPYAIMIGILMSWALYYLLAPESWHEWASAGVFQAFIIALYTEMYGFPLTIYILSAFLPLKIPLLHSSGHVWATLLGFGSLGIVIETIVGYALLLAGALLVVKGWVKIYFASGLLADDGVYRFMRHPQYTGIFLMMVGEVVDWPTIPTLILFPVITAMYLRLALREEARLTEKFGAKYRAYQNRVPMFIPNRNDLLQYLLGG